MIAWAPLRRLPSRPWLPVLLALILCLLGGGIRGAAAQVSPSLTDIQEQLDQVVGNRVEATVILGGPEVPQGGLFTWSFNGVDAGVLKYPWSVELGDPRPVGESGLTWTPVLLGSAGTAYFVNKFRDGPLAGNESTYTTYSLGLGAGSRLGLLADLSVLPSFSVLYAYTENDFDAGTEPGRAAERAVDGRLVNWHTHTLTFVPALALRYRPNFGRVTLGLVSTYTYFATVPVARSTEAYSFTSESQVWNNRLEIDVVTPWSVAGWPLLVGGSFERAELFGGLRDSLKTGHFYAVGGYVGARSEGPPLEGEADRACGQLLLVRRVLRLDAWRRLGLLIRRPRVVRTRAVAVSPAARSLGGLPRPATAPPAGRGPIRGCERLPRSLLRDAGGLVPHRVVADPARPPSS